MIKVALAGQPNCGKSTLFNLLSGIDQHIANYPGVTVEKKSGTFTYKEEKIEMVDLPGTYSFSSYSLEERVAKHFILDETPDIIVDVVDASNLKRNLYLTFQLLEIEIPVIVVLNMSDVAKRRGIEIDASQISSLLGCPVIEVSGAKKVGKEAIMEAIFSTHRKKSDYRPFHINYEELEPFIAEIQEKLEQKERMQNRRWLAVKIVENDPNITERVIREGILSEEEITHTQKSFTSAFKRNISAFFTTVRCDSANLIFHKAVKEKQKNRETLTDKADKIILNRWLSFPILLLVLFSVYELAIVFGYKLTDYTWPLLASFKNFVINLLPVASFTDVPIMTDFGVWMINSALALVNYIPIFFLLFVLIAVIEDIGYMPRMAFILDRIFKKFGLHGQSTLPFVLGGAVVGGCAVPGVMATKGIADERARMATILTVPYMNCLAKVPFYTLLLGAFFPEQMGLMMFFISTATLFIAFIVAKNPHLYRFNDA